MPFTVTGDHRYFFQREGRIILEEVIPAEDAKGAFLAGEDKKGRGLFSFVPPLKTIACKKSLARVAVQLEHEEPLILGFDQIVTAEEFFDFFEEEKTLWHRCSLTKLHSAFLFCLKKPENTSEEEGILPTQLGDALFLSTRTSFPRTGEKGGLFYLVAYAPYGTQYQPKETDPFRYNLKDLGYSQGMRIKTKTHPQVFIA